MLQDTAVWGAPRRIGYLVLAVFLLFNTVSPLLSTIPVVGGYVMLGLVWVWGLILPWVGTAVLGLPGPIEFRFTGSGDTTWDWVQMFTVVVLSLGLGIAWALLDHKRASYAAFNRWLMVLTRYTLASSMVGYGLAKVFKSQFPFPGLAALTTTYGDSSPMGLAWRFMGYSEGYNYFTGGAEVLAGVLLLWRRTTTLGALTAIGVTANIVALNFFYDIPVKLYSSTLLLMALYLAACDGRRLVDLLVRNRATGAREEAPYFTRKPARIGRVVVKSVFCGLLALSAIGAWQMQQEYGDSAPRPPLYGLYAVETFTKNGAEQPPLLTNAAQWRQFFIDRHAAGARRMDGARERLGYELDEAAKLLRFEHFKDEGEPVKFEMKYEETADGLILRGPFNHEELVVVLKKLDHREMLLVSRGFHWINEDPFNR